ncbi:hypothetical protein GCM10022243_43610 [Saccharothrix violaceirubra]|uniref:Transglutaminase-like putative cysteine protease n=1 Tax=Saccharothrix violaceirubra TaxID=413306 RepID=A0A7W7T301_9PSEU|nr:transglutaminase domain-containing protein [Saccharothrix violaceirubra]MBB4965650.1 transglutaminase-like putative cysteine protease [Saccharothrix violaceirubra]
MTSVLVTPWWRRRAESARDATGGVDATGVLDWTAPAVAALLARIGAHPPVESLRAAHRLIAADVRPVYAVDDLQPISRTLRRGRGSCSQRMAVLEGVARALGIATRVRGLVVDGRFWYPRFPRLRFLVPDRVLLAWPEFALPSGWTSVGELFGGLGDLASSGRGFTNAGGETLFDAVAHTAVDWDGMTCGSSCDLSATVLGDLGRFDSRDALFRTHGQTLCPPLTLLADPVLSRWAPPATRRTGA